MTIIGSTAARVALFLSVAAVSPLTLNAQSFDKTQWAGMHYRMIGPDRGGRVTTVTGVPSQPFTFYMGTVGGGVYKTTDAGHSWHNLTDGQIAVGPIGAVEVSISNPEVVYAGTGSSKIRSNISIGKGIYKSTDAGKTWTFIGLKEVGQIATIRVDPTNADIVYVAAQGNPLSRPASAVSINRPTAARAGRRYCSSPISLARPTSSCSPVTPT